MSKVNVFRYSERSGVMLLMLLLLGRVPLSQALHPAAIPASWRTHQQSPDWRRLVVSLPFDRTDEWIFDNKTSVLSGQLTLTIATKDRQQQIVIYQQGQLNTNWQLSQLGKGASRHQMYFQLSSIKKYLTTKTDRLKLTLITRHKLKGRDPYFRGYIKPGCYVSNGKYGGLTDEPDIQHSQIEELIEKLSLAKPVAAKLLKSFNYTAYCNHWQQQWPLTMSHHHNGGWLLAKPTYRRSK